MKAAKAALDAPSLRHLRRFVPGRLAAAVLFPAERQRPGPRRRSSELPGDRAGEPDDVWEFGRDGMLGLLPLLVRDLHVFELV